MKLTFESLNVQSFTDWKTREPAIVKHFKQTDPDIILFQEVTFLPQIDPYTQVTLLNKSLHYPYEATHVTRLQDSHEYETYREGLGILSKWPILRSETLILKQQSHDEHQRIVQLIDLLCNKKVVRLAHVHFSISDNDENLPREHLYELLEILTARGETRIIGGDFNMNDIELHADLWQDDYISSSTTPYISYPPMNKRVDYFLLPKSYDFLDIHVSEDGLSDHRALGVAITDSTQSNNLLERVMRRSTSFKI
jgi:endonuclease/exonuclease/phosphatase family metal-dependent hydrolase